MSSCVETSCPITVTASVDFHDGYVIREILSKWDIIEWILKDKNHFSSNFCTLKFKEDSITKQDNFRNFKLNSGAVLVPASGVAGTDVAAIKVQF